jgi:PAS domain S-box-containing protein
VAVFWPASGIAAGIFIKSARRTRPALAIGVVVGTIAADLMSDRNLWIALCKGFCNAGEAALVAGLIERWFGRAFAFADLRRVLGLIGAVCLGAAASGLAAASTMTLLNPGTPFWDVWRTWSLSHGVGILMVAPLVIELGPVRRSSRAQSIEGAAVLSLLALISLHAVTHPTGSWLSFDPDAVVLPLILWLIARCQPIFGIAGAFVESATVVYATTFGIGHFGNADVPIMERVSGAQVVITMVTLYTLVLVALFAQRRESEAQLAKKGAALARLHEISSRLWLTRDLRKALDEILAGAIELLSADMGAIRIWDSAQSRLKIEAQRGFKRECLDLFRQLSNVENSTCERALQSGERMVIEDVETDSLFAPFRPLARAAGYCAMQSTPILNRDGRPLGMLATHFRSVHRPAEQDLRLLDVYVRQAADIIERHRSVNALRESEERLRLAQLRTGVGLWDWNLRTGKVTWTPELEAIFGLEPGSVQCYADFRDRVHPDDIAAIEANRDAALRRRETFSNEFRIIRPDGNVRWILAAGGAFYDGVTGEPTRILGNNVDITERKETEARLQKSEQLFRELLGALPAAIYVTDAAGRITYCNEGAVNLWGASPKLGEDRWSDLARFYDLDGKPMELTDCPTEIALKRGKSVRDREAILERADGTRIPIIPYPTPMRDRTGATVGVINMMVDISERKEAEQTLAERNAQLALAGKAALVGSYAYDSDLEKMTVSEGYARMHGLPEGTTQTTRSEWLARVHPDDHARMEAFRMRTFDDKRDLYNVDYRIVRVDGEVRWIESRSFVSYDAEGQARRVIGINIDVTDRKHTEALLRESKSRLADALAAGQVVAFEWDAVNRRTQRSDNAERILGVVPDGHFLRQVHSDDRARFTTHLGGLSADNPSYALAFRFLHPDGSHVWLEETAKGEFDRAGKLLRIKGLTRDITECKRAEERQRVLVAELDHRVKNVLATVSAVVSHTLEGRRSVASFAAALEGRIRSMAMTHELLSSSRWQGIQLTELIHRELAPYATRGNTDLSGPQVILHPEAGQAMAIVLHELATNAAKYGALSSRSGRVSIRWDLRRNGQPRSPLVLEWQEIGGPPVVSPGKPSYGTSSIRDLIPYEYGGSVDLVLAPEGVRCRLELPADWLNNDGQPVLGTDAPHRGLSSKLASSRRH